MSVQLIHSIGAAAFAGAAGLGIMTGIAFSHENKPAGWQFLTGATVLAALCLGCISF